MPNYLVLPTRAESLNQFSSVSQWESLESAIRPDARGNYISKACRALNAGLPDAALNYFWNAVEEDLRKKVIAYGLEFFTSTVNKPHIRNMDELREDTKAHELISGCYSLGIIGDEAHFQLQHAREIRNRFSAAHESVGEIDLLETLNFLKNCVKYSLCFDPPAAGFQIKDFVSYLEHDDIQIEEVLVMMRSQSSIIHKPLLHNLLTRWIDPSMPPALKKNARIVAPEIWNLADDRVRSEVAQRYASLKERPTPDAARGAEEFLKVVNGIGYIPEDFRFAIFKRYAEKHIEVYFAWDNFRNEPAHARALSELGHEVPKEAAEIYAKAVMLSFVGNSYGYSNGAQEFNTNMLEGATTTVLNAFFNNLNRDAQISMTLMSSGPRQRLKSLVTLIQDKALDTDQRKSADFIMGSEDHLIRAHFANIHFKLSRVK
jgi:hypothetical protein